MSRQFASVGGCGLRVRVRQDQDRQDPSASAPGYRGTENRLYRVQVHSSGTAQSGSSGPATFKWSRENGSLTVRIERMDVGDNSNPTIIEVTRQGGDRDAIFAAGDWVELMMMSMFC